MKKIINLLLLGTILMLTACVIEEEKTGWEKHNPVTLETITYRSHYTRDQKGGYYKNKAELINAFNEYAVESFTNVYSGWDVTNKLTTGNFTWDNIVDELPYDTRNIVETTTLAEVKQKLQNYKTQYEYSCLAFPNFSYSSMQIMIYYLEGDTLKYQVYDSYSDGV